MGRRKKQELRKWESDADSSWKYTDAFGKKRTDSFCMIFSSLLESAAFTDLSARQRILYILCVSQCYGKRKPGKDFRDIDEFQGEDVFYLNWREVSERYKLSGYSSENSSRFYADMRALESHGFVKQICSGKPQHKKSVWQLDWHWRVWQRP